MYDFATCQLVVVAGHDVGAAAVNGRLAPEVLTALQDAAHAVAEAQHAAGQDSQAAVAAEEAEKEAAAAVVSVGAAIPVGATSAGTRVMGGGLGCAPGEALDLRLLLDWSLVELFAGTGEALATRVYRGEPAAAAGADGNGTAGAGGGGAATEAEGGGVGGSADGAEAGQQLAGQVWLVAMGSAAHVSSVSAHCMRHIWIEEACQTV